MEQNQPKQSITKEKPWIVSLLGIFVIGGALFGFLYWQSHMNTVAIKDAFLEAPVIALSPIAPGILNAVYVHPGDTVPANAQIASVGTSILATKEAGIVASVSENLGSYFAPGQTVATVVAVSEMKVVGAIEETKGLKDLSIGQRATFTVDAFPGKKYEGTVSEIAASANDTSAVFTISDKRPIQRFNVKVQFNSAEYPELKNGMSAKITVHIK